MSDNDTSDIAGITVCLYDDAHLNTCFQQACVWLPISRAILNSISILSACAACRRANFGRPLNTDDITDAGDEAFLSAAAAAADVAEEGGKGCDDDDNDDVTVQRRNSSWSDQHEAIARCSNTAAQRSYRPVANTPRFVQCQFSVLPYRFGQTPDGHLRRLAREDIFIPKTLGRCSTF